MYMGVRFVPSDNVEDIFVKWNWRKKSLKWSLSMNLDEFLLLYDAGVYFKCTRQGSVFLLLYLLFLLSIQGTITAEARYVPESCVSLKSCVVNFI